MADPHTWITPRRRAFCYWTVAFSQLIVVMSFTGPSAIYVIYQHQWDLSPLTITAVFAVYAVTLLASLVLLGGVSDLLGRRPVLVASVILSVGSAVLFAYADSVGWLYLARGVQGVAAALISGTATAALVDFEPTGNRNRASLVGTIAQMTGSAIGPLLYGLLADYAFSPTVFPYIIDLVLLIPASIALMALPSLRPGESEHQVAPEVHSPAERKFRLSQMIQRPRFPHTGRRLFILACATLAVTWAIGSFWAALTSLVTADLLHLHDRAVPGEILFIYFGLAGGVQLLTKSWGQVRSMLWGVPTVAIGIALLYLAVVVDYTPVSIVIIAFAIIIGGWGAGVSYMGALAAVVQLASPLHRAAVVSAFNVAGYIGVATSVIAVGLIANNVGLETATGIFVGLSVVGSALLTWALRSEPELVNSADEEQIEIESVAPTIP